MFSRRKLSLFFVFFLIRRKTSSLMTGSKSAVVFLAEGAEEIEFITTVDVLRRAKVSEKEKMINNLMPYLVLFSK
jgi:hypothetical protein